MACGPRSAAIVSNVPVLRVDVDAIYAHASGGYLIANDFYATVGVRRMALKYDIDLAGRQFERKPGLWDPLIGVGWHHYVGDKLELHATFEGGGFGVGSDVDLSSGYPPGLEADHAFRHRRRLWPALLQDREHGGRSHVHRETDDARSRRRHRVLLLTRPVTLVARARSSWRPAVLGSTGIRCRIPGAVRSRILLVRGDVERDDPATVDSPIRHRCAARVRERIGKAASRTQVAAGTTSFRIDFSDLSGGFDLLAVANVPTVRKAGELKAVIDAIKYFTGAPKVILVGHSLGGLASRAYIQGIGRNRKGETMAYSGDVAALIMISTPNQGSVLANLSGKPEAEACTIADTANLRDLQPTSDLLTQLNGRPWPAGTSVHSIVSNNAGRDSDDVVTTDSQDLTALAAIPSRA